MTPQTLPFLRIDDRPLNFVRTILWKNLLRTVTPLRYRTLSNYLAQHVSVGYIPLAACGLLRTWPPKAPGNSGSEKSVGARRRSLRSQDVRLPPLRQTRNSGPFAWTL